MEKVSENFLMDMGKISKISSQSLITKYSGPLLPTGTIISYNNCSSYCNELILAELGQARLLQRSKFGKKRRTDKKCQEL
jgi:hypothetical protein